MIPRACRPFTMPLRTTPCPTDRRLTTRPRIQTRGTPATQAAVISGPTIKVRVGGAAWSDAADLATWTAQVTLAPGANRIDAQSFDNAGNPSDVRSVNVTFTPPPPPPPPPNTPPYANFSYTPATGNTTTVFTFTSTSFDHEDPADMLQVRWDWETDGVWDTPWSHNATEQHRFTASGTYNVTMEVIDTGNLSANRTAMVIVSAVPPPPPSPLVVEITATPTEGTMPVTVSFTSHVGGGVPPYTYDWEFGDGSKSNAANTVHIYITGGNFTVWLNVDDNGGTSVQSAFLFVNVTRRRQPHGDAPDAICSGRERDQR